MKDQLIFLGFLYFSEEFKLKLLYYFFLSSLAKTLNCASGARRSILGSSSS
jgi:hypothetical protein